MDGVVAMALEDAADPYGLTPEFERALVALLCSRPRFYGMVGRELDAECMVAPAAQLAVTACQEIAKGTGGGPGSPLIVIQHLRLKYDEGAVTRDEIDAVDDMIAEAEDAGLPPEDDVLAGVVPILKRRMQLAAIRLAHKEYGKRHDMDKIVTMLERADSLGQNNNSLGVKVGGGSFGVIDELRHLERLSLGVDELDSELDGGPPRGTLTMFIGAAGDGKSMALSHWAAHACRGGLFVAYATLELPEAMVLARIKANHTKVPINAIIDGSEEAKRRLAANPPAGPCYVKEFTPQLTTVTDLKAWVEALEELEERPVDVLMVDYADKLTAATKEKGSYKVMELVYEYLRIWMHETKKWGGTASQSTRGDKKSRKVKDLDDVSDSINKARVVDLAVTLNLDEDEEMKFHIAKFRYGRARQTVGPLPTDFACGAIAPVSANNPMEMLARPVEGALEAMDDF